MTVLEELDAASEATGDATLDLILALARKARGEAVEAVEAEKKLMLVCFDLVNARKKRGSTKSLCSKCELQNDQSGGGGGADIFEA